MSTEFQLLSMVNYLVTIQLTGLIMLPICSRLFSVLPDKGYATSKFVGILYLSLSSWILTSLGLPVHTPWGLWFLLGCALAATLTINHLRPVHAVSEVHPGWRYIILIEALFLTIYCGWNLVRWCSPDIAHTEQPMDFMLLNAVMKSTSYPAQDLWLFNFPISYYYFGYWMQSIPALMTGCPAVVAYNLNQSVWFAMSAILCFGIGSNISAMFYNKKSPPLLGGLTVLCSVLLISNTQGVVDAITRKGHWWWWSASRVVHDGPAEMISEFPAFSLILGDNHPHLLNLPTLLLAVTMVLCLLCSRGTTEPAPKTCIKKMSILGLFLLPILFMTNSWDLPAAVLLGLCGIQFTITPFRKRIVAQLLFGIFAILAIIVLALPYHLTAQSQVSGLAFLHAHHTSLLEWLRVFGLLLPGILIGVCLLIYDTFRKTTVSIPAMMLTLLLATGLTCALVPELVYVKDMFGTRMNTVFKFYYQAWIYLSMASSIGIVYGFAKQKGYLASIPALVILLSGLLYPARAVYTVTNHLSPAPSGINGTAWIERTNPDLANALHWITANTPEDALIVTAPGRCYHPLSSSVSTYAGRPELLGWTGHEEQWRGGAYASMTANRKTFINQCYLNGPTSSIIHNSLWPHVRYLFVGKEEREFMKQDKAFFESMTQYVSLVFSNNQVRIYEKK